MNARGDRPSWVVEPLGKSHDRGSFSCGKEPLDRYLKNQAGQDARRYVAAPFIMVESAGSAAILGYYTLSAFGIELSDLPEETAKRLPRYPIVPATMLGRLAVDEKHRGKGFGAHLLMDALYRAQIHAGEIASGAVVVDSMDEDAGRFYRHFSFIPFPERPDRLFLPMATVRALFG